MAFIIIINTSNNLNYFSSIFQFISEPTLKSNWFHMLKGFPLNFVINGKLNKKRKIQRHSQIQQWNKWWTAYFLASHSHIYSYNSTPNIIIHSIAATLFKAHNCHFYGVDTEKKVWLHIHCVYLHGPIQYPL